MTRRGGIFALAASLVVLGLCAGLVAWRLAPRHPAPAATPAPASAVVEPARPAAKPQAPAKISTIIDLPGDPVLVRRGVVVAPKALRIAAPTKLAANAPKLDADAFYVGATLVSTDGGYMGKFPEAGQEADALAAQLAMNSAQMAAGGGGAAAADSDDDGGDETPSNAPELTLSTANSNQLEVFPAGAEGRPQIKQTILRAVVAEKISDLLIANGFAADSAHDIENAAKAAFNVQTLPPQSVALAVGALDSAGDYRATQIAIYEDNDYVGSIALADNGLYGDAAQPALPAGLLDDSAKSVDAATHFDRADGIYSAGLRNGMPEPVIREAIQLLGRLTDLKSPLLADDTIRAIFARDYRDKTKSAGKIVYVGLRGGAVAFDCYSFEGPDGAFRCFDPKAPAESTKPGAPPQSLGESGATSVGGILAPIKGAPVTSLFGTRFHPILHILRLHAGIDFGAPIGSQVRASADGKVEIAGPVSGFGNHVRIQHKGFETSYSHLSEIPASIKPGAEVTQGEIIALSGNTGLSTGPHLHFEFYLNGTAVDPMPHMGTEVQSSAGALASSGGTPAPPIVASGASAVEMAAFPAAKATIDAALEEAAK